MDHEQITRIFANVRDGQKFHFDFIRHLPVARRLDFDLTEPQVKYGFCPRYCYIIQLDQSCQHFKPHIVLFRCLEEHSIWENLENTNRYGNFYKHVRTSKHKYGRKLYFCDACQMDLKQVTYRSKYTQT